LPAIETTLGRLAAQAVHPRELEHAARALGSLTRTLRELNGLLSQRRAQADALDDDEMPKDIDAFRQELARRIRLFIAARTGAGAAAGAPPQPPPQATSEAAGEQAPP